VIREPEEPNPRGARPRVPAPAKPPGPPGARPRLVPGVYQTRERMLDGETKIPPGHVAVSITALIPYDGTNGRTPTEEAARLFEDPGYLSSVLDAVPNRHFRLLLKVPSPAR
jgi:hypothetical protein